MANYSVIVDGHLDKSTLSDERLAELERHLLSKDIPLSVLENIQPGKAILLKKSIPFNDAILISDWLLDLGFDTDVAEVAPAASTTNKPASGPAADTRSEKKPDATKAPAPKKQQKPLSGTANVTPLHPKMMQQQKGTRKNNKDYAAAAEEVKNLFSVPKSGIALPETTGAMKAKLWFQCAAAFAMIGTYFLAIVSVLLVTLYLIQKVAALSPVLMIICFVIAIPPLMALAYLLVVPLFYKKQAEQAELPIKATQEPRLFLFVTAISKILGSAAPKSISITTDPEIKTEFVTSKNQSTPEFENASLRIGVPVLHWSTLNTLAGLIAREVALLHDEALMKPTQLLKKTESFCLRWVQRHLQAQKDFNHVNLLNSGALSEKLGFLKTIVSTTSHLSVLYFHKTGRIIQQRFIDKHPVAEAAKFLFVEENEWVQAIPQINSSYSHLQDAAERHLAESRDKKQLINNLYQYAAMQSPTESFAAVHEDQTSDTLISQQRESASLIDNIDAYAKFATKSCYKNLGLDVESLNLVPLEQYLQQAKRHEKIERTAIDYFGKWFNQQQFWRLPKEQLLTNATTQTLIGKLNNCIGKLRYQSPDRPNQLAKYSKTQWQLTNYRGYKKLISTGLEPKTLGLNASTNLDHETKRLENSVNELANELSQQNMVMGERLALGLLLDKENSAITQKLLSGLRVFSDCGSKVNALRDTIQQYEILNAHKPKGNVQQYQLYNKELKESLSGLSKQIAKRFRQCPFDFYNKQHESLFVYLQDELEQHGLTSNSEHILLAKAQVIVDVAERGYKTLSELAANFAFRMEKAHKIDTIRRIETDNAKRQSAKKPTTELDRSNLQDQRA